MANHRTSIPPDYLNPVFLGETPLELWADILKCAGVPVEKALTTSEELQHHLERPSPPRPLLDAIETLYTLGAPRRRDQVIESLNANAIAHDVDVSLTHREFIGRLWVRAQSLPRLRNVLAALSEILSGTMDDRTRLEYHSQAAISSNVTLSQKDLLAAIAAACRTRKLPEIVSVVVSPVPDGCVYAFVRKGFPVRQAEIQNNQKEYHDFIPAVDDWVKFEQRLGRLTVVTRSATLQDMYRQTFGELMGRSPEFFLTLNASTLEPLQRRGRAIFEDSRPLEVSAIRLISLVWRYSDDERITFSGPDCFATIDALKTSVRHGRLEEAKLKFEFRTAGRRMGTARVRVPRPVDINAGVNRPIVEAWLDTVGIRGAFDSDKSVRTLWTLRPWRHPEHEWRRFCGSEFGRLCVEGVLRPFDRTAVGTPDHPGHPPQLQVVPIDEHTLLGVDDDHNFPHRILSRTDTSGYQLDTERIAQTFAAALDLDGGVQTLCAGIHWAGERPIGNNIRLKVVVACGEPTQPDLLNIDRMRAGAHVAILVPTGCRVPDSSNYFNVDFRKPPPPMLLPMVVSHLGLTSSVDPSILVDIDVVVSQQERKAWHRGVFLSKLGFGTYQWRLLERLAESPNIVVSKREITSRLAGVNGHEKIPTQANKALVEAIKTSYEDAGQTCPSDIDQLVTNVRSQGYRLNGTAFVIPPKESLGKETRAATAR